MPAGVKQNGGAVCAPPVAFPIAGAYCCRTRFISSDHIGCLAATAS